jgi:hypothetical protein
LNNAGPDQSSTNKTSASDNRVVYTAADAASPNSRVSIVPLRDKKANNNANHSTAAASNQIQLRGVSGTPLHSTANVSTIFVPTDGSNLLVSPNDRFQQRRMASFHPPDQREAAGTINNHSASNATFLGDSDHQHQVSWSLCAAPAPKNAAINGKRQRGAGNHLASPENDSDIEEEEAVVDSRVRVVAGVPVPSDETFLDEDDVLR